MNKPPTPPPLAAETATSYPAIQLNWEDWLPMLENESLTDTEKRQLIEALHNILVAFVDLGWGIASPEKTSGEVLDLTAALRSSMVCLDEPQESEAV